MRFKDKVVIITGAASGIGKATAHLMAKKGAQVVVVDVNEKDGQTVAAEIQKSGGIATFISCNVANKEEVTQLFEKTTINERHLYRQ